MDDKQSMFDEPPITYTMPDDDAGNKFPLPKGHTAGLIIGKSGSGKTTLLLQIIPLFANLSQVIICSKIDGNPVHEGVKNWCEENEIEYEFASEPEQAMATIEQCVQRKEEDKFGLIVFDDFAQGCSNNRDNKYTRIMITTYQQLRNYGYRMISITQSYTGVCTLVRNNANFIVLFPMTNIHSIRSALQDIMQATDLNVEEARAIIQRVQREEHGYMMISRRTVYLHLPSERADRLFEYKKKGAEGPLSNPDNPSEQSEQSE